MARRKKHHRRKKHMARRRSASRSVVVRQSRPIVIRTGGGRRLASRARHYAGVAGRGVASEKHTLFAVGAAFLYGVLRKSGVKIPSFGPFGPASTTGLGLWALGRWGHNTTAAHAATGLLSIAAYQYGSTGEVVGEGTAAVWED
jgi:hypothetical protein